MARVKRRRSLRGLGGSPEHHAGQADLTYKFAEEDFHVSIAALEKNKCADAFMWIKRGLRYRGRADTHREEAKQDYGASGIAAEKAEVQAIDRFRKSCLVGGGLSGARRRRRK